MSIMNMFLAMLIMILILVGAALAEINILYSIYFVIIILVFFAVDYIFAKVR